MTYEEQLYSQNWKSKRESILKRDNYRCIKCLNSSLFEQFRISLIAIGVLSNGSVVYGIYDKISGKTFRCKTNYDKNFLRVLKILKGESNSLIALTGGNGKFSYLISTLLIPEKLELNGLSKTEVQKKQENYLKWISDIKLRELKWIDTKGLHIHHKYYQLNKFAWEYPEEALTTLCWSCHEKLHLNTTIEIRNSEGIKIEDRIACVRCYGAGEFPKYNHIQNGICFKCKGRRFEIE